MSWVDIECICGKREKVFHYDSRPKFNKQHCSEACRQAAYRQTEKGKAAIAEYNKRYKRPEKEYTCWACNTVFMSTRKRVLCDEHSTQYYRNQRLKANRPDIVAGIRHNDCLHKKIKRGTMDKPRCFECGKDSDTVHFHHPDYTKPKQVVALCPECHHNNSGKIEGRKQC